MSLHLIRQEAEAAKRPPEMSGLLCLTFKGAIEIGRFFYFGRCGSIAGGKFVR
jgi:hypothetical protein